LGCVGALGRRPNHLVTAEVRRGADWCIMV
jgi:hypothetical protein